MFDVGEGGREDLAAQLAELVGVGARGYEQVFGRALALGQMPAVGQNLGHVLRRLVGRRDESHAAANRAGNQRRQNRVVRAAKHQRVHAGGRNGGEVLARHRVEGPAQRLQISPLTCGFTRPAQALLHNLHKLRACGARHLDARVQRVDGGGVGARPNGAGGGNHAHSARSGGTHGGPRARLHHAHHGHVELALSQRQASSRGRVAGNHNQLHLALAQPRANFAHEAAHLVQGPRAIGATRGVAKINEPLGRQTLRNRARHRQPAQPGIKYANRLIIHASIIPAAICGESEPGAPSGCTGSGCLRDSRLRPCPDSPAAHPRSFLKADLGFGVVSGTRGSICADCKH